MNPNHLNRFVIKAQWMSLIKKTAPWLLGFIFTAVVSFLFADDVLLPVSARLLIFSLLTALFLLFVIITIRQRIRFKQLPDLSPLETETVLKSWSGYDLPAIKHFLNHFYLHKPVAGDHVIPLRKFRPKERNFFVVTAFSLLVFLFSFFLLNRGFHDIVFPFMKSAHLVKFEYSLNPGNSKIERGDTLIISASFKESPGPVFLVLQDENNHTETIESTNGQFITVVKPNQQQSLLYHLENDWFQSDYYRISVIDRPFIQDLAFTVIPPKYTGSKPFTHTAANGNSLQFPEGSRIQISARISKAVQSGTLSGWKNQPTVFSDRLFQDQQQIFSSKTISFRVLDTDSLSNRDTVNYRLSVVADQPPTLQVLSPDDATPFLNRDFRIPVRLLAIDDYGIRRVLIRYRVLSAFDLMEPKMKDIIWLQPSAETATLSVSDYWTLPDRTVTAGDWVEMQIGVADSYPFSSGGHTVWSDVIRLKAPELNEVFNESEKLTQSMVKELDELSKKSQDLAEKIKKTTDEVKKKSGDLTFTEEQQMKQLDSEVDQLKKELEKSQKNMDNSFKKLNENQTLSPETLQKYMELQQLIQETKSDKLKSLMQKMQDEMALLDRKDVQQVLDQMQMNNDAVKDQLDKSIKAIKRLQNEQKIEEMAQRANELFKRQQEIQKEAQSEKPDFAKIESMQNMQTKQLEDMKNTLSDVRKTAESSEEKKFIQNQLEKMERSMKDDQLVEKSKSIEQSASENREQKSGEQSNEQTPKSQQNQTDKSAQQKKQQDLKDKAKDLSQKLEQTKKQSDKLQEEMKENQNMVTLKLLRQLLIRSNKWSELSGAEMPASDPLKWGASYTDALLQSLKVITDSAAVITEREPQEGMILSKNLDAIRSMLEQSKESYVNNQLSIAEQKRTLARSQMNAAIYRILQQMNQQANQNGQQGSQGDQQKSFMDEMRELANRQQQLNQQTLNEQAEQQQSGEGQMSQTRLTQLAAQQQAIRQQLQELMERSSKKGENSGLSSDMGAVEKEMEKAAQELTRSIDSKLIERQQKILNRMLESQKSTIQREFEEKRESFANKQLYQGSDKEIKYDASTLMDYFILNSQMTNYPESYQRFIRSYLQAQPPPKN